MFNGYTLQQKLKEYNKVKSDVFEKDEILKKYHAAQKQHAEKYRSRIEQFISSVFFVSLKRI